MFERVPDERLRAYLIWQPILSGDNRVTAERRAHEFQNERFTHFWDNNRATGNLWKGVLGLKKTAWDVYLVYNGSAEWTTDPPRPDYWVPQLQHSTRARFQVVTKGLLREIP